MARKKQEINIESKEDYKAFRKEQRKIKREKSARKRAEKKKEYEFYCYVSQLRKEHKRNTFEIENKIYRQQLEDKKAQQKIDFGEKSIKDYMSTPKSVDQNE